MHFMQMFELKFACGGDVFLVISMQHFPVPADWAPLAGADPEKN